MLTDILTRHEARGLSCSSRFLVTLLGAPLHLLAGTGGPGNAKCEAKNGCEEKYQEGGLRRESARSRIFPRRRARLWENRQRKWQSRNVQRSKRTQQKVHRKTG